jgi:filamentous hemagglutinin family protein
MKATSNRFSLLLTILSFVGVNLAPVYAQTRTITPALDGTGTVINRQGNQFEINGGSLSGEGQNLFHSFEQFNLSEGQVANFLSNPNIRNILGRVVGGDASFIHGLIQVTGGNSNLFLMNPAGMIFGANASLNVPASFTATTANGIGFGTNQWFNTTSNSDWSNLVGTPNRFRFDTENPGSIVNQGQLAVTSRQQLTLLGGTVLNTGTLVAPEGTVSVQTVPGENLVRIAQTGHLLNLEVAALPDHSITPQSAITPLSLPELLTGGGVTTATGMTVNPNGEIVLTSGQVVESGDVAIASNISQNSDHLAVTGETVNLKAANTLTIAERSLQTTGDLNLLAGNTVQIRDSLTHPFSAIAGGNLTIVGQQNIDILALDSINVLESAPFQATGNLTLASDGIISGDSHFNAGGNFSILNSTTGAGGTFISLYDPIIYSDGDVIFGSYEGASLKVEATGAIIGGDINITTPDINLADSADPEANILSSSPALILRSGVQNLGNSNTSVDSFSFIERPTSGNNNLTVGNVTTAGGPVILNSAGRIVVDQINTQGGEVNLQAVDNIIIAQNINSDGGNIEIITDNLLRVGTLVDPNDNTPSISSVNSQIDGAITIEHGGGETPFIIGDATTNGTARSITSSSAQITPQFEVPRTTDGVFTQGNITIRTTPLPSEEPPINPSEPPVFEPEEPITENPPIVEPPEEPSEPNPGNNPPVNIPREDNPQVPNNPNNPGNENPQVPNTPNNPGNENPQVPNNPNNPGNENPQVPNIPPVVNPPVVNPPNNPSPEVPNNPETDTLTSEQQEQVTNVIEAELVERKSSYGSSANPLKNQNVFTNNSILDITGIAKNSSSTMTVQQNTDGSIALLRLNPINNSVQTTPIQASEFNPEAEIQLARADVAASFDVDSPEAVLPKIEQAFSLDYLNYIGKNIAEFETDISVEEIQDNLSEVDKKYGTKAAVVYTFAQADQLVLMAVTAKGDIIKKTITATTRQELLEITKQFRLEITDARKRYTDSYKPLAQQLYQWIISPLEDALEAQEIDTILFVMDQGLRGLPMAALHDGEQFLIEKYNFSLIPSFSLMDIRDQPLNDPQVLAMGASTFVEQPPLPAVPIEVKSITKEIRGRYFLNEEFTIKNFSKQRTIQPFNIIHLATHSEFNSGDSSNSYIQFWDTQLTLNNLKQLGWKWETPPAELFVLSACRTAVGDVNAELGFAGLAVQAGVPSALASLWYVSDQGTLGLMVEFYNQLRKTSAISQAFRAAQIAMLRGTITIESGYLMSADFSDQIELPSELMNQGNIIFTHPYYWAGFTIIGSPW